MRRTLDLAVPLLYVVALLIAGFVVKKEAVLGGTAVLGLAIVLLYFLALRPRKSS